MYLRTFTRKDVQYFSLVKLNLSCSKYKFDADTADGNIQMDLMELKYDAIVKYKFCDIE